MKRPAVLLALALLLLSAGILAYRILWMGYPVIPTAPGRTWQLEIDAHIMGGSGETTLALAIPNDQFGPMLIEERVSSGTLNFNILRKGKTRIGAWSGTIGSKEEEIVYRSIILIHPKRSQEAGPPPDKNILHKLEKMEQATAERMAGNWRHLTPLDRVKAVIAAVDQKGGQPVLSDQGIQEWRIVLQKHGRIEVLIALLEASGLPARVVTGLQLVEGIVTQPLNWIDVWNGQEWEILRLETGEIEKYPARFLPLTVDNVPTVNVSGGDLSGIRWIINREIISQWRLHFERSQRSDRFLDRWSLFRLPPEFQETFRILLLVPIGAFIVGFLRNVIGLPTFGVFMPVLLALAFRSTGLAYGLGIFAGILLLGYAVRSGLDQLRLLLVPRMSVILTLVIACFTIIALVGNKVGLRHLIAVGLLPFVILTMIIERFFVLIEEAGLSEGIRTVAGSAAVSVIAYGIISWESLQLTFFVFPELLAAVTAFQILLGRYTGYRLSEAIRFRSLRGSP